MTSIRFSTPCSRILTALFLASSFISASLFAQTTANALPRLNTDGLTLPGNWQRAGSVMASPTQATLKTASGNGLLVGNAGQPLTLAANLSDFAFQTEVLMTPGTSAQLTLPTGQTVPLTDARLNRAPGLWQTVSLRYRAAIPTRPATIDRLVINGITVREGQTLSRSAQNGPLTLTVQNGSVALRNVGYRGLNNRNLARWNGPLNYTIFDGENPDKAEAAKFKVLKQDTTLAVSYESSFGQKSRNFTMLFSGKLNVTEAATYQFDLDYGGRATLYVDGKSVIKGDYKDLGPQQSVELPLTAGQHEVEVVFARTPWIRPGLGLFVSLADTRPQPLHTQASLPEPNPVSQISVQADARPQLVRSFVQLPGEKLKRTHALSVGTPAGMHYTLDLNQMALLQVWKGDFADVTEMWHERGEPQVLKPLGANVLLAPQTALMVLTDANAAWPDSVSENILQYKGLSVDKAGMPTTEYTLGGATVTDAIRPTADGLFRTLTLTGTANGPVICRLAAGTQIDEIEKGLYAINDRAYYIRIDPKLKPQRVSSNGKQELRVNVKGGMTYEVVF